MNRHGFFWWLAVAIIVGSVAVLLLLFATHKPGAEPLPSSVVSKPRGHYWLYSEKLQDGTFCVIVQSPTGSGYYGPVAVSCDFTCRNVLNEGAVCK